MEMLSYGFHLLIRVHFRVSGRRFGESRGPVHPVLKQSGLLLKGRKQRRLHSGLHKVCDVLQQCAVAQQMSGSCYVFDVLEKISV